MRLLFLLSTLLPVLLGFRARLPSYRSSSARAWVVPESHSTPDRIGASKELRRTGKAILTSFVGAAFSAATSGKVPRANAIGKKSELQEVSMVLQDMQLYVQDTNKEAKMLNAVFQDTFRTIRRSKDGSTTTMAFGPDAFESPKTFTPGLSTFAEDGGHATLTLCSKSSSSGGSSSSSSSSSDDFIERGNGLQFIRFGSDVIRISKGVEAGGVVNYAYGWVDIDTPSKVPLEIVVGIARDPLMLACLRVSDVQQSVAFFTEQLGMKVMPTPLARSEGSEFEPAVRKDAVFVGYGKDLFGLLLVPLAMSASSSTSKRQQRINDKAAAAASSAPLVLGDMLGAFTIVIDDKASKDTLAPAALRMLSGEGPTEIASPDGYRFVLQKYTDFARSATKTPVPSTLY